MSSSPESRGHPDHIDGRILALDLGEKRIGIAVSDPTQLIARSLQVIKRSSRQADFQKLSNIVEELNIKAIIVGLPLLTSGGEGPKAAWVRDYAADVARHIRTDVLLWDESLSTVEAEASMRARGIRGKRRRERVDAVAAAIILQSYLDAKNRERTG